MKRKYYYVLLILVLYILAAVFTWKESLYQAEFCFVCGSTLFWLYYPVIHKKKGEVKHYES